MGKIDLNTLRFSGRYGEFVAYSTKQGKQVYRKYTKPTDPKTPKQQALRMRFGMVNKVISPLNLIIKNGFKDQYNSYRSVISHVLRYGVEGEYPNYSINYSEVKVAKGELVLPNNIVAAIDKELNKLKLTWDYSAEANSKRYSRYDNMNIVCFNDELQKAVGSLGIAKRGDMELEVDYKKIFEKIDSVKNGEVKHIDLKNIHFWLYLTSQDYSTNSNSIYLEI